ncbi:hypothetical protein [Amycolatopsis taiwanensis]|uniref:hypothetical protein n=1 Tax=Amycolatopsis taiwanensis TaxID=342230 RepID=UPI0012EB280A|nr:hypothetical protein [Amycolatopsis taiwanensis]
MGTTEEPISVLLWDQVIDARADEVRRLSRVQLAELATGAIEGTVELFAVPFAEFCPPPVVELVTSATRDCRASAPEWRLAEAYLARFTDALDAVQGLPMRPGCGPLTMATLGLVESVTGDFEPDEVLEVLSSCYEAIVMSQLTGRVTIERERENEQCRRALALQQDLISRFSGGVS